jgi:hypothetical protein
MGTKNLLLCISREVFRTLQLLKEGKSMKINVSFAALALGFGMFAIAPVVSSDGLLGTTAAFAKGTHGGHSATHSGKHSGAGSGSEDDQGGVADDDQGDDDQGGVTDDDQGDDDQGDDSQ